MKTLLPNGKLLRSRCRLADRSSVLLLSMMLVVGVLLLSCRNSPAKANDSALSSSTTNSASSSAPTSPGDGKPNPSVAPNSAANAGSKQQRLAEPKKIIPAPQVFTMKREPRIAFTNEEVDFGNVEFGDVIRVAFEFKNVGSEPLKISKAQVQVVEGC